MNITRCWEEDIPQLAVYDLATLSWMGNCPQVFERLYYPKSTRCESTEYIIRKRTHLWRPEILRLCASRAIKTCEAPGWNVSDLYEEGHQSLLDCRDSKAARYNMVKPSRTCETYFLSGFWSARSSSVHQANFKERCNVWQATLPILAMFHGTRVLLCFNGK